MSSEPGAKMMLDNIEMKRVEETSYLGQTIAMDKKIRHGNKKKN